MFACLQTGTQACRHDILLAQSRLMTHGCTMMFAVVNQKGGVAKSTLAVHLAVWNLDAGRRVALIDADGQSSSSRWITAAGWPLTLVTVTRADAIIEVASKLRSTHDIVVADGPANLAESTRALLLVADFAVVPCGVSLADLESTAGTIRMLENARRVRADSLPPGCLLLTRVRDKRCILTREAHHAATKLGLPLLNRFLPLREAMADAPGQRSVVWNMGPKAKQASHEMKLLLTEIHDYAERETNRYRNPDQRGEVIPLHSHPARGIAV
jgi:chromosome partitioning protein